MVYGMSQIADDAILHSLASNSAAFEQLLDVARHKLADEEKVLNEVAQQSLLDASKRDLAVMQLGRVSMIRDIIEYANRFLK